MKKSAIVAGLVVISKMKLAKFDAAKILLKSEKGGLVVVFTRKRVGLAAKYTILTTVNLRFTVIMLRMLA